MECNKKNKNWAKKAKILTFEEPIFLLVSFLMKNRHRRRMKRCLFRILDVSGLKFGVMTDGGLRPTSLGGEATKCSKKEGALKESNRIHGTGIYLFIYIYIFIYLFIYQNVQPFMLVNSSQSHGSVMGMEIHSIGPVL